MEGSIKGIINGDTRSSDYISDREGVDLMCAAYP